MSRYVRSGAIAAGVVLSLLITLALFGLDVPKAVGLIVQGSVGSPFALSGTLLRFTPLCLTAMGIVVAWRAGMYNIGGEGQYLCGGCAAAGMYLAVRGLPAPVIAPILLVAAAIGGGLWGWLAGWLYVKRGVQIVISTILLNFIAVEGLSWLVRGPIQQDKHQLPLSQDLPNQVMMLRPFQGISVHSGVLIAVVAPVVLWLFLSRTKAGFLTKVVGANPELGRTYKVNVGQVQLKAMAISGAACGLAAGVTYVGVTGKIGDGFGEGWGFLAIPVALLGGLNPWGVALAALYFGALFAGTENLQRYTPIGSTIVAVVQAIAVLAFVAIDRFFGQKRFARD